MQLTLERSRYDLRTSMPLHKTVLNFTSNKIAWNPMEAFNFAVASEDHNIYMCVSVFCPSCP